MVLGVPCERAIPPPRGQDPQAENREPVLESCPPVSMCPSSVCSFLPDLWPKSKPFRCGVEHLGYNHAA